MSKIILVTGCAGFIGSHLVDKLLENENIKVVGLDDLSTGSLDNIKHILNHKRYYFLHHDIISKIPDFIRLIPLNEIYNLACPASPIQYQKDPLKTFDTSVVGIRNLLEIAKEKDIKLLHTSTSEVYGNPTVHPQPETYYGYVNPTGMRSCYDEGKRAAETLMFDYNRIYGTKIKIVRIFNTYGPRLHKNDGRVVSNFINQSLNNEPITIYGDGSQTRSLCYVQDTVEALIKMMNTNNFIGPVNIGNPKEELTVLQLANKILGLIPESDSIITNKELPSDDPVRRKPDINLAREKLNWQPSTELRIGLLNTINYFKERLTND